MFISIECNIKNRDKNKQIQTCGKTVLCFFNNDTYEWLLLAVFIRYFCYLATFFITSAIIIRFFEQTSKVNDCLESTAAATEYCAKHLFTY